MIRMAVRRLFLVPLAAIIPIAALAATDFRDISYLQVRIGQVLEREPTGAEIEWLNEATGNSGMIRVLRTYFPSPNAPCRDYERSLRQPGAADLIVTGTGCREPSGRWRLKEIEAAPAAATIAPSSGAPAGAAAAPSAMPSQGGGQQSGGQQATPSQGGGQQGGGQQAAPTSAALPPPVELTVPPPEPEAEAPAPEPPAAPKKAAANTKDEDDLIVMPTRSE